MGHPCEGDMEQFNTTYINAQRIVSSRLEDMPPKLQGFDSFTALGAGFPGQECISIWWVEGVSRLAERLEGGNVFFDCWPDDNYLLGFPTPTP